MTLGNAMFLGFVVGVLWLLLMQKLANWIDKKGQNDNEDT